MMPETIATVAMPNSKRRIKMRSMAPLGVVLSSSSAGRFCLMAAHTGSEKN
jgi:hypothetical protein